MGYLTIRELAERWRVSYQTAHRQSQHMRVFRSGRVVRVSEREVERYERDHMYGAQTN